MGEKFSWQEVVGAMRKDLVEFGYSSLTFEQTEQALEQALDATPKEGLNITAMFIYGWLEDEYKDLKPMIAQLRKERR